MIAAVASIERTAAIKRKISITMLLNNDFLSSFLDFSNICSSLCVALQGLLGSLELVII